MEVGIWLALLHILLFRSSALYLGDELFHPNVIGFHVQNFDAVIYQFFFYMLQAWSHIQVVDLVGLHVARALDRLLPRGNLSTYVDTSKVQLVLRPCLDRGHSGDHGTVWEWSACWFRVGRWWTLVCLSRDFNLWKVKLVDFVATFNQCIQALTQFY